VVNVFFLSKIKHGMEQEYEKWVKEVDYPTVDKYLKSVRSYTVVRVREESKKNSPWNYIECVDLTSKEDYDKDRMKPEFKRLITEGSKYIESDVGIYADPV